MKDMYWKMESQQAFEVLKKYMAGASFLVKPSPGETLYVYLTIFEKPVTALWVKEEGKVQKPVNYVRKVLNGVKLNYSTIEKFVLAMIVASRKLPSYFQAYKIKVLTNQPSKNIIHSPKASGRLIKWAVGLGKFDIKYVLRTTIKTQALANILVDCTIDDQKAGAKRLHLTKMTC